MNICYRDTREMIIYCIIFTETERRIRANNREYNSQFNYAVRETSILLICQSWKN